MNMRKQRIWKNAAWLLLPALAAPAALLAAGQGLSGLAAAPAGETAPAVEQTVREENRTGSGGSLSVLDGDGLLRQMELDSYLTGVLLSEMPASFPEEALKAQAVVARTYAGRRMEGGKHGDAAVCMDPGCCQGYLSPEEYLAAGGSQADVDRLRAAVAGTEGLVLTYGGELIDATYFSCSGGQTEDAVAVWGQNVPYLQSVESPGEEDAPRYTDTITFTPDRFRALTGCAGGGAPETWFGTVTYTEGGGVDTLELCGRVVTGKELRSLLGLRSTAFSVEVREGQIVIDTRGYGHRVGMSQYGARAMALEGADCAEILAHYYTGTALETWNPG